MPARRARGEDRDADPVDNPHEVGADRLVNSVAAHDEVRRRLRRRRLRHLINFDVVSAEGEYLGGAIGPGRRGLAGALTGQRAAKLPRIDLPRREAAIGKLTAAAIQSGVVFGFAGLIDGVVRRIEEELGDGHASSPPAGSPPRSSPFTETIDEVDEMLTLQGPAAHP